jgi:uncharacterized protein YggE
VVAQAAGVQQITLVAVVENGAPGPIRPVYEMAMMKTADANTPVQPGENTVTASVTVRYRFVTDPVQVRPADQAGRRKGTPS